MIGKSLPHVISLSTPRPPNTRIARTTVPSPKNAAMPNLIRSSPRVESLVSVGLVSSRASETNSSNPYSPQPRSTSTEATAAIRLPGRRLAKKIALNKSPPTLPAETKLSRKPIDPSRNASSIVNSIPWQRTSTHHRANERLIAVSATSKAASSSE